MEKAIVKVKVDAVCLSCRKSTLYDLARGKIFCELKQEDVADEDTCSGWECNGDLFDICGMGVEMVELPSLFSSDTVNIEYNKVE